MNPSDGMSAPWRRMPCGCRAWRTAAATYRAARWTYRLGVTSDGGVYSSGGKAGHKLCLTSFPHHLQGRRLYILGAHRNTWRCWRKGHRRGEPTGIFGFCGRCVPWPCCGSTSLDHAAGCPDDEAVTA